MESNSLDIIVPIPFNFYEVKIGAILTTIYIKKFKVRIAGILYRKDQLRGTGNTKPDGI
jgi:hypothetical protein